MAFCQALPERAGVVAIPSQVFHDDQRGPGRHLVRWAFCKTPELISEGIDRLAGADLRALIHYGWGARTTPASSCSTSMTTTGRPDRSGSAPG